MRIEPSIVLQLNSDVRQTRVADEGIILRQDDGEILVVNEVAIRFVELIDGQRSLGELADLLLQEYETEKSTLIADLAEYAGELVSQNVLNVVAP
ncbi:MAG TPA: PqqD family protein [Chromatiaceae bacterium]|nr:PqqD family protein [Chromatiaceae bacterium]